MGIRRSSILSRGHVGVAAACLPLACFCAILSGCRSMDYYESERAKLAKQHFREIRERHFSDGEVATLEKCVALSFEHNLDVKVAELGRKVASERAVAETLGMLPVLEGSYQGTSRDNEPGASSQDVKTGRQSLVASKSNEKVEHLTKVELIFSVLDFGLAYFNSVQADDKTMIADVEKSITERDLALDVTKAYFRVAAAQYALRAAEPVLADAEESERVLTKAMRSGAISPLRALDEMRNFSTLRKKILAYRRGYGNAMVELNALIGNCPVDPIKVDDSMLDGIIVPDIPDIELMERVALFRRPELMKLDMQKDVLLQESRKAILKMLPNVRIFVDFTNSSNTFLYNHSWWEIGLRAAYDLFKLPRHIMEYKALLSEMHQSDVSVLALSVGVLSQVRIAHANVLEAKERFEFDDKLRNIYAQYLKIAEKKRASGGKISRVDVDRLKLELANAEMERAVSLGNYYLALQRLLRASGVYSFQEVEKAKKEMDALLLKNTAESAGEKKDPDGGEAEASGNDSVVEVVPGD